MNLNSNERTFLSIDGSNLYGATRALGFEIDYKALLEWISSQTRLVRANYYMAIVESDEYTPVKPLTDWLAYNGYNLITKAAKEYTIDGKRRIKGDMAVELTVDALELAPRVDHVVLFSGDGDFRRLVEAVQRCGARVTVVSTVKTTPSMVSDELRRQADQFVDLADIAQHFRRADRTPRGT